MFYMAVRYEGDKSNEPDLNLIEGNTVSGEPQMSKLSTLLAWHAQDPVDHIERARNDKIHDSYQSNRNPFIDHPEWVGSIWSSGGGLANVIIAAVLPNPNGSDTWYEKTTLENLGSQSVTLSGWYLRDAAGNTMSLSGTLGAGASYTFQRNGASMSLNNGGDTIDLLDNSNTIQDTVNYGSVSVEEWVYFTQQSGGQENDVTIYAVLPNPPGSDTTYEKATFKNHGSNTVNLSGWSARDAAGNTWSLSGLVASGATITIQRNGMSMSLNNSGDTVELLDTDGNVVDVVSYGSVSENQWVYFE